MVRLLQVSSRWAALWCALVCVPPLYVQDASGESDGSKPGSTTASQADFQTSFQQWKKTVADLHDLQLEFRSADERAKAELERRFDKLYAEGQRQFEQVVSSAIEALDSGKQDPDALAILSSNLETSFNQDDHPQVLRLAEILLRVAPDVRGLHQYIAASAYGANDFDKALKHIELAAKEGGEMAAPMKEFFGGAENHGHVAFVISQAQEIWKAEAKLRAEEAEADDLPRVKLETSKGDIVLELYENQAPNTVANFISLVKKGFYDNTIFHRVLPHFMAQGGDPDGNGTGGPGYLIPDELDDEKYRKHFGATLSMAKTALPDTGGSQFFITFKPTPGLDGKHTVFGRVIEGYSTVAKLNRIDPDNPDPSKEPDRILRATVVRDRGHDYTVKKVGE